MIYSIGIYNSESFNKHNSFIYPMYKSVQHITTRYDFGLRDWGTLPPWIYLVVTQIPMIVLIKVFNIYPEEHVYRSMRRDGVLWVCRRVGVRLMCRWVGIFISDSFSGLTPLPPPPPKKGYVRPKKEISEKNICSRVIENKNSGISLLNLRFNMTVYEVLLQIQGI